MRFFPALSLIRWVAAAASAVAAVLSYLDGDYLRAAGLACIAVVFALLATETGRPGWTPRKTIALVLVLAALVVLAIRLMGG